MKKLIRPTFIATLLVLSGCASTPMADPKQDAAMKNFTAKPGVVGVYIYRNETFGFPEQMDIKVDGKLLGHTTAKTYFYTELNPGKHIISARAQNIDTLELDAQAGKLYFVWQEVKTGIIRARTKLHAVDSQDGEAGVRESRLIVAQ